MKKFGVFDLDGTVFRGTLTFSVAEELLASNPEFSIQRQKVDDAREIWKRRESTEAYWAYNKMMLQVFAQICPLVSTEQMAEAAKAVLDTKAGHTYAYTTEKIRQLKEEGRALIAISGSISDIVQPFADTQGFDIVLSSDLEVEDGKYTGKRVSQTNKEKDKLLAAIVAENDLTMEDSVGVGDTHRDIPVLAAVANPLAFNPNAALYDEALKRGWPIVIERKNMIYELSPALGRYAVSKIRPIHDDQNQEQLQ